MNNFEWLYENDRDTLLTMVDGDCDCCKFDSYCEQGDYRCDRNWLEEEYGEPDSWEKIEFDTINIAHNLSQLCPVSMVNEALNLVYRCKKLAGVE